MDPARHSNRRLLPAAAAAAGVSVGGGAGAYATVGGEATAASSGVVGGDRRGRGGGSAATGDGSGAGGGGASSAAASGVGDDGAPPGLEALTREELLRRRSRRLKRLLRRYRRLYWALAEGVRGKHREYWWEFGRSPVEAEEVAEESERRRCRTSGCKAYAMPITKYCHLHILMDKKQTLYKACSFVIRSSQDVQHTCGKPVLRATVPSLCPVHLEKAQKLVSQALKKAGLNASTSSSPAPKFHVIIAEYVRQIQDKRRRLANTTIEEVGEKGGKVD